MADIAKGYQLHVTTWENDGDNYNTKILSGLSKQNLLFWIELAKKFSCSSWEHNGLPKGRGNNSNTPEQLIETVRVASEKYKPEGLEACDVEEILKDESGGYAYEFITDSILGYSSDYANEPFFTRVYESHKVFYYPEIVKEVTGDFK